MQPHSVIISMMKDEGHSLLEWLAYHRLIGFRAICVYTNDCSDGTDRMLDRLEQMGLCHHVANTVPPGRKPQGHALGLAAKSPQLQQADWLLVLDVDEFVHIKTEGGQLSDLMAALPDTMDALMMTWRMYGSSGITAWDAGLVTDVFTRAAPDLFGRGWGVKTLYRPKPYLRPGIHRPKLKGGARNAEGTAALANADWRNGSGARLPPEFCVSGWHSTPETLGRDLVEVAHYGVKSYEGYMLRQLRGNVNNKPDKYDDSYFAVFDRNEIAAPGLASFAPRVRALMSDWLQDARLAQLQAKTDSFHRAQIAQLRTTGVYQRQLEALQQAGATPYAGLGEVLLKYHVPPHARDRVRAMIDQGMTRTQILAALYAGGTLADPAPG